MNLATLLVALIATTAPETSGDPVLLDFTASWCGPCKSMRPELDKLVRKGYPVRAVDIDRSPEVAERYQVKAVPTFIIVDPDGKVLARTSGAMPASRLAAFYNETKTRAPSTIDSEAVDPVDSRAVPRPDEPDEGARPEASGPAPLVNPNPWATVVRIKMHLSDSEWGFGSGTVISSSADESIILTCAHIFRLKNRPQPTPGNFRVPISVDLFDGQIVNRQPATINCSEKDIKGEAIDYDFTNDVGLIRIRPGRRLAASRVVPPDWKPRKGMKMYAVGCSHGHDATAWDTTILDPRIPMSHGATKQGFVTMKCAYQPMEGRSGGGLYTTDGYVAGVCDFADPNEKVGLYAVPEAIHRLLDRNQYAALYKRGVDQPDILLASDKTRANGKTAPGTRIRAQNSPLKDSSQPEVPLSIPPFNMVASREARDSLADARSRPWKGGETPASRRRTTRSTGRPETPIDSIDPGAPVPTEMAMEPSADARAFADPDPAPAPRPARPDPAKPSKTWKPARQALPDLASDRPDR